jgi:hypothetical protein
VDTYIEKFKRFISVERCVFKYLPCLENIELHYIHSYTVFTDSVSAVSVIRDFPRPKQKWKVKEVKG